MVTGQCINEIPGQDRFYYQIDGYLDLYDLEEITKNREYKGNLIRIYDLLKMEILEPIKREKNIAYDTLIFVDSKLYFIKADFNKRIISVLEYEIGNKPKVLFEIGIDEVNLYNLSLINHPVYLISQDETIEAYYPKRFSIPIESNQNIICIKDEKIYLSEWIEEEIIENEIIVDYKYYEKLIICDLDGNIISERIGNLQKIDNDWCLI